jgi:hypothetical protein
MNACYEDMGFNAYGQTMEGSLALVPTPYELLYQLHLLWLRGSDTHALNFAICRLQDFKSKPIVFDHFTLLRDPSRQFAD